MKLESFRELLIKKSEDPGLQNLVAFLKDDFLADMVIESLEKMARAKSKGDAANIAIRDFGSKMDPEKEPNMIHDALSHHISHYKAALGDNRKDIADQHAKQIYRIVDMADQAQKHSNGKLHMDAVSPHPWERNAKQNTYSEDHPLVQSGDYKPGDFVTKTKGWRHRGSNFDFLRQAPDKSYANEVRKHGNNKAYPLEQMRVNGKYVDVQDIPKDQLKGYEEHPFDKHPIMEHFEKPVGKRTPEDDAQWSKQHEEYGSSPHMDKYYDMEEAKEKSNPDEYAQRGSKPSLPVHDEVPELDYASALANNKQGGNEPKTNTAKPAEPQSDEAVSAKQKAFWDSLPDETKKQLMSAGVDINGKK